MAKRKLFEDKENGWLAEYNEETNTTTIKSWKGDCRLKLEGLELEDFSNFNDEVLEASYQFYRG